MPLRADALPETDDTLIRNIARAHTWFERVRAGETFGDISKSSVMDGDQPAGFTSGWCKRNILPSDWAAQRAIVATL